MRETDGIVVTARDGLLGHIDASVLPLDESTTDVCVRMDDGQEVWVPAKMLQWQEDGTYFLPLNFSQINDTFGSGAATVPHHISTEEHVEAPEAIVLPLAEERAVITSRAVKTGGVRVTKQVHERQETVDEPGFDEEVEVRRVAMDRVLDEPAKVRFEGDTMVIPIMEEVLVVEKRLVLKEEVHITKYRRSTHNPQQVTLRSEEATVERYREDHSPLEAAAQAAAETVVDAEVRSGRLAEDRQLDRGEVDPAWVPQTPRLPD